MKATRILTYGIGGGTKVFTVFAKDGIVTDIKEDKERLSFKEKSVQLIESANKLIKEGKITPDWWEETKKNFAPSHIGRPEAEVIAAFCEKGYVI